MLKNISPELIQMLVTSAGGSLIGTVIKSVTRPDPHFKQWLAQAFTAITVGTLGGAAAAEYFNLGPLASAAFAAASAYVSEEILRFLQAYVRKLSKQDAQLPERADGRNRNEGDPNASS